MILMSEETSRIGGWGLDSIRHGDIGFEDRDCFDLERHCLLGKVFVNNLNRSLGFVPEALARALKSGP